MWYWRQRFKTNGESSPQWIPVAVEDEHGGRSLTIRIGKMSVDVQPDFDRQLLRAVLEVLSSQC